MRSLILALALSTSTLTLAPAAFAQEDCAEPMNHQGWSEAMDEVDRAFAAFDPTRANQLLDQIRRHVPCLNTVALPSHVGRFARLMAVASFFEQDEINAVKWGTLQEYAAPGLPWPEDYGEDHPLRRMLANADTPPMSGPEDAGLVIPRRGAIFLNGHLLERPQTLAEVPGLIQIADRKGELLNAYWQDGAAFREDLIGPPGSIATHPRWFTPEDPASYGASPDVIADAQGGAMSSVHTPGSPPPRASGGNNLPVGQLIVSGGLGILAGSLYAIGAASRGGLDQATNEDELVAARTRVNLMVVGAGAAAAAGVGVGVTAFIHTDGGGLRWNARF